MNIKYITIEREYGSGGTLTAQETARRCGIPCYGREILETVAARQNLSVRDLEQYEENVSGSLLYSFFVLTQSQTGDPDLLSKEAKLYVEEAHVIREQARMGPAIFVGHCASHALRDCPGVLRVFIHAEEEDKRQRIIQEDGIAPARVNDVCRKINKRRANYYAFCTRKKWSDLNNYDIVLDSSRLGIGGCAAALSALYREGKNK